MYPLGQPEHLLLPASALYSPGWQRMHAVLFLAECSPAWQGVHNAEPFVLMRPASHGMHSSAPVMSLYFPAAHLEHFVAPVEEK